MARDTTHTRSGIQTCTHAYVGSWHSSAVAAVDQGIHGTGRCAHGKEETRMASHPCRILSAEKHRSTPPAPLRCAHISPPHSALHRTAAYIHTRAHGRMQRPSCGPCSRAPEHCMLQAAIGFKWLDIIIGGGGGGGDVVELSVTEPAARKIHPHMPGYVPTCLVRTCCPSVCVRVYIQPAYLPDRLRGHYRPEWTEHVHTFHFPLPTPHFPLPTPHSPLPIPHSSLLTWRGPYFLLGTCNRGRMGTL